jgi:hypothetical protein
MTTRERHPSEYEEGDFLALMTVQGWQREASRLRMRGNQRAAAVAVSCPTCWQFIDFGGIRDATCCGNIFFVADIQEAHALPFLAKWAPCPLEEVAL